MLFWFSDKFSSVGACGTWVRISPGAHCNNIDNVNKTN